MMDFDSLQDDTVAQDKTAATQPQAIVSPAQPQVPLPPAPTLNFDALVDDSALPAPTVGSPSGLKFDDLKDDAEKYSTPAEQVKTGLEGAAQGFLSKPIATALETNVLGVKPEDIAGREETNPWIHGLSSAGALAGGFLTGTGEAGLLAKAGEAAAGAARLGKIGSAAIKGAIETGLIQTGDEIGNAMLGKGDPEAPVASALSHIGASALLGGSIGGGLATSAATNALKSVAETKAGTKLAEFMEDFGNRWKFNTTNPNLTDAVGQELTDFHETTKAAHDAVYGNTGLKAQAIEKLVPPINETIQNQNQEIANKLQGKVSEMLADPESYPLRLTKKLQGDVQQWMEVATQPDATSNQIFNATQDLKQTLQAYSKFDRMVGPLSPEKDFINVAKELQHGLRTSLEDSKVWGAAGDLQQGVNKAFTEFLPSLKDFESKFATKIQGEATIDPGKIQTYVNQMGNPRAAVKQSMMKNFVDAADKYRSQISRLHNALGVENAIPPTSLNAVRGTLGQETPGGKFADFLFRRGIPEVSDSAIGGAGAGVGYSLGGPFGAAAGYTAERHMRGLFENLMGRHLTAGMQNYVVPAMLKIMSTGENMGVHSALNYATAVAKGTKNIDSGVEALFKSATQQAISYEASESDREKLRKFVANGEFNKQIQSQMSPKADISAATQPHFAQGGEVRDSFSTVPGKEPVQPMLQNTDALSTHFPTQAVLMSAAKSRVNGYLNSIRPQPPVGKLPFDTYQPNKDVERKYNRALDVANQPLSVLGHIQKGTLTPEHVGHLNSMYPELGRQLANKISEYSAKSQMSGSRPSYKVRQGVSLLTASPADSTFTPQAIQAAQPILPQAQQQTAMMPASNPKHSTSKLSKMPSMYKTQAQSAEQDRITRDK